jgi:hypothetical protein
VAAVERNMQLFSWGDITAERYASERDRLGALRDELLVSTAPQPTIRIDGMLESWRLGNPEERRQLLGVFFDALHVKDGQIVAQTPREDRVTEVVELIAARDGRS